ncbi:hypothetical protein ABZU32_29720 [Sphaerisporangium sp. NPDC005288]|uniref:hypothetical protein n=1 Tax=Sphaerisporangium sp. NPDC005288 TaxID=3155114 RepID=UPI0033A7E011
MRERVAGRAPAGGRHLRTFSTLAAAGLAEAVLSSLSLVALVRVTGAETSGGVIFAQSVAGLCFLFLDPRLDNTVQRYVPIEQRRDGRGFALYRRLVRWDVGIRALAAALCCAGVAAAWLLGLAGDDLARMLALALIGRAALAANGAVRASFALSDRLHELGLLRLGCAVVSFALPVGGLLAAGPLAYLAGQAVAAMLAGLVVGALGTRALLARLGPSRAGAPLPDGLVSFTAKATGGTALAEVAESGVLTVAGLLGGSALVTILKIASAPGRLYATLVMPVASMLYPRLARAAAAGRERTHARRDIARASVPLAAAGLTATAVALPLLDDVLRLVYGRQYAAIGPVAAVLVAAACVKGLVCWSNVLPLALGRPGWRLAYLAGEGAALLAVLLLARWLSPTPLGTALCFAWGTLAAAVAGAAVWAALLRRICAKAG